jgi:hypothetical protein
MTKKFLYLFIVATTFTACYQDVEGCLDVNASNLDLDADFACLNDDCCTYPTLSLSVTHRYNGEEIRTDSFYRDAANNQFRLNRLRYYWTELVLNEADGDVITPVDSVEFGLVPSLGDTTFQLLNDNLVLISTATSESQNFGVFRGADGSVSITGKLGVEGLYSQVFPASAPANHPLNFQEDRMYYNQDSNYLQLKLEYDLIQGSDTLSREINVLGAQDMVLLFPGIVTIPRGINVTVFVDAETDILLNGIDLAADNDEIVNQLIANAPVMWTVTELLGN